MIKMQCTTGKKYNVQQGNNVQQGKDSLVSNFIVRRGTREEKLCFYGETLSFFVKIPCCFFFVSYMTQKPHVPTYYHRF